MQITGIVGLRPVLMAFQNPESGIFGPDSGIFSGHWSPDFGSHVTFQLGFPDSTASTPNGFQKLESGKVITPKSKAETWCRLKRVIHHATPRSPPPLFDPEKVYKYKLKFSLDCVHRIASSVDVVELLGA